MAALIDVDGRKNYSVEYLHPEVDSLIESLNSEDKVKSGMDRSHSSTWAYIQKSSGFALLTNKVFLLKNILHIMTSPQTL